MKSNLVVFSLLVALVATLSGCTGSTAPTMDVVAEKDTKTEVELVPARKNEEGSSKTEVVERDGKYYEMLKEHERICSDCDK